MSDVTVLGTGLMGAAIVRTLLAAGHAVTVWNRTPERAAPLAELGATVCEDATAAVMSSPVTLAVILHYDAVRDILEQATGAGYAGDVVNLTTGTPADAEALGSWAEGTDMRLLDGVLHCYPAAIGDADARVSLSGSEAVWHEQQGLLRALAGESTFLGPRLGLANAVEGVVLSFVAPAQAAVAESIALGQAHGVSLEMIQGNLTRALGSVGRFVEHAVARAAVEDYSTTDATITTWVESTSHIAASARALGLQARQIDAAADSLQAAHRAGRGDQGFIGLHGAARAGSPSS
jgi:3-hydroxyisobutyrate dehydrogenase-like beta-hydroxyacid dehydrogenase